jgi:hypothetical protein
VKRRNWTDAEIAHLREHYANRASSAIAKALNRSVLSVYQGAAKLGLRKSKEFLRSPESGILVKGQTRPESIATQFKPGQIPANKGRKMPGWAPGRMGETQFKPGDRTGAALRNWKPIGAIAIDPEGYRRIKVREHVHGQEPSGFGNVKVWPLLHRHIWEQANGPIPPKHIVSFIDGNRANCTIENLELITMADNCRRNSMWTRLPRELAEVVQLNGVLKRKLRKAEQQVNG